mmetsp:Transcript_47338/g.133555  ORF Transcript_47338/g.133555 Transcript_47338/m.133555 type:complete len:315 (+) Transcript_47338:108-1052(+)
MLRTSSIACCPCPSVRSQFEPIRAWSSDPFRTAACMRARDAHEALLKMAVETASILIWGDGRLVSLAKFQTLCAFLRHGPPLQEVDNSDGDLNVVVVVRRTCRVQRRRVRGRAGKVGTPGPHRYQEAVVHEAVARQPLGVPLDPLQHLPSLGPRHEEVDRGGGDLAVVVGVPGLGPGAAPAPHVDLPPALVHHPDPLAVELEGLVIRAPLEVVQSLEGAAAGLVPHGDEVAAAGAVLEVEEQGAQHGVSGADMVDVALCELDQRTVVLVAEFLHDVPATDECHLAAAFAASCGQVPVVPALDQKVIRHTKFLPH